MRYCDESLLLTIFSNINALPRVLPFVQATVLFLLSVESAFSNDCNPEVKIYCYAGSGK